MKTLVALFGKQSTASVNKFMEFSLSNPELNSVRGGTEPYPPIWIEEGEQGKRQDNP